MGVAFCSIWYILGNALVFYTLLGWHGSFVGKAVKKSLEHKIFMHFLVSSEGKEWHCF